MITQEECRLLQYCCRLEDGLLPLTLNQYLNYLQSGSGEDSTRLSALESRAGYLEDCLSDWEQQGIAVCTYFSPDYPAAWKQKLRREAPVALFLKGDRSLLSTGAVSLVGSRELREENTRFAERVGTLAANAGLTLISGNARGADRTAQDACLAAGGRVISIIADSLLDKKNRENLLYVSEERPNARFTSLRAIARNRLIHTAGDAVFVAQVTNGKGGTWSGTNKNLTRGWTPVYVYQDGTLGAEALEKAGAIPCSEARLRELLHT